MCPILPLYNFSTSHTYTCVCLVTPLVSWLGCTFWVPGSCWPHPQMVEADWTNLPTMYVQVGSQASVDQSADSICGCGQQLPGTQRVQPSQLTSAGDHVKRTHQQVPIFLYKYHRMMFFAAQCGCYLVIYKPFMPKCGKLLWCQSQCVCKTSDFDWSWKVIIINVVHHKSGGSGHLGIRLMTRYESLFKEIRSSERLSARHFNRLDITSAYN